MNSDFMHVLRLTSSLVVN